MNINYSVKLIDFGSTEYLEMVDLRRKILRLPLGLDFSEEDLNKDNKSKLFCCYNPKNELLGCCVVDIDPKNASVKVRQMAVFTLFQNKGIGSLLIRSVEGFAKEVKINRIYLHARKIAVGFYEKQGYSVSSNEFTEVNIPHFVMEKRINLE